MASAKMASAIDVRIDDVGSVLKFRIGLPFRENSAGFCQSVWLPGSILNFRIGSVSSIGGSIAATLFAATISDPQRIRRKSVRRRGRRSNQDPDRGSQHPSPNVKTLCNFELQIWPEMITSRDMPKVLVLKAQGCHVM